MIPRNIIISLDRTVTTYSDGTVSTSYSVSRSGKGINSVVIMYCLSSQGVNPPVDGWQFNIPYVSAGLYLWTRTVTTYTDDTTTTSYSVSRNGLPGGKGDPGNDGKSIHSITEYYLASSESSGVTIETPGWTTSMQQVSSSKRYLWNYEKITYTDNSTSIVSPHITGVYGDTGSDGKGIQSITEYYLASSASSGVTIETPGWTTSMQQVSSSKRYLWNYEKITYTDNYIHSTTISPACMEIKEIKERKEILILEKGDTEI